MTLSGEARNGLALIRLSLNQRGHLALIGGHGHLLQLDIPILDVAEVPSAEPQAVQLRSQPERHRWIRLLQQVRCERTIS
jgi:hypothetical protein